VLLVGRWERSLGPCPASRCVLPPLCGNYWCALRYADITDSGTRPRSLTVTPACRAQVRTSALLAAPADRAAVPLRGLFATARATPAPFRGCVADLFGREVGCWVGSLGTDPWLATTRVTPYRAPRTRIASWRGSLESRVSLIALPFYVVVMTARARRAAREGSAIAAGKDHPPPPWGTATGGRGRCQRNTQYGIYSSACYVGERCSRIPHDCTVLTSQPRVR
jgi:hypothetical protein